MRRNGRTFFSLSLLAKKFFAVFLFVAVLVGVGSAGLMKVNAATAPRIIMYQGRLLNSSGVPVSDATASVSFALYSALSGGTCLWSNNSSSCASVVARTVTLTAGLFSEPLGDTAATTPYSAIPATVFSNNASVYLEVIVNSETLTPRKQMLAAPYAMNSDVVDGYDTSLTGGTSSVIPVTDATGNLVITGAPQGTGVNQGSLYVNPATATANFKVLGVAVGGTSKFSVDSDGDVLVGNSLEVVWTSLFDADVTMVGGIAANGGDLTTTAATFNLLNGALTTLNLGSATATMNIGDAASTHAIDIGGNDLAGTDTVRIATNATGADTVTIGNSSATTAVTGNNWSIASSGLMTTANDIAVNGGDLTSTSTTFNALTSGVTSLNFGSGATTLGIGSSATTINVGAGSTTVNVGSGATNLNLGASATGVNIGTTAAGTVAVGNGSATTSITGGNWSIASSGLVTTANDAAINGGDITSSAATFNFLDAGTPGVTALNIASTGTTINMGDGAGSKIIDIGGVTNNGTDTISIGTNATSADVIAIGNSHASTAVGITSGTAWSIGGAGLITTASDIAVNGGDMTTTASVFNLINTNATTLNIGGAATTIGLGAAGAKIAGAGALTLNSADGTSLSVDSGTTGTLNLGIASFAKTINLGTGTAGDIINIGTNNTTLDTIAIGSALDTVGLTASNWSIAGSTGVITTNTSLIVGDSVGADTVTIGSAATTQTVLGITANSVAGGMGINMGLGGLTSGTGLNIVRAAGGSDFTGKLVSIQQNNTSPTTTGVAMEITQSGGSASSVGLYVTQSQTSAHAANATGANALVIDIKENGSTDDAIVMRSDSDGNGAGTNTTFRVTSQGEVFSDFAFTGTGADFAEYFATTDPGLGDSSLVCMDPLEPKKVQRCAVGDSGAIGVTSTDPAFIGNNLTGSTDLPGSDARIVGLLGQIDTLVDTSGGAIAVGDAIATSSTTPGYGTKAHGPVRIVGFALEALSSGTGTIRVLVRPEWYGGDVLTSTGSATQVAGSLAIAATTSATASSTAVDSASLSLNGSVWNGGTASAIGMSMKTAVNAADDYRLSMMNGGGTEVASVNNNGDFALTGKLYPSDRGAAQYNKYIYYDGSSGSGGDFMRTNAAGWSTGSYDFAEMFPSTDALVAGEVVTFGDVSQNVKRSSSETYNQGIAGIVSTRPGFLAGENIKGNYPIALSGRVPTLVSSENGAISIGDPLTTSTKPGYAMKATEAGPILGYAAEAFSGSTGKIVVYVNVSYYGGQRSSHGAGSENTISALATDISHFDTTGTLNFNGGQLLAVGSMTSASGAWRLESGGDLVTSGRLIELIHSADGTDVKTYPTTSTQTSIQLAGTATLVNGHADVKFADIDTAFTGIMDPNPTYRALVTPYGATGTLYVTNRTVDGFSIVESGAASNGIQVDWLVVASRRDFAPVVATPIAAVPAEPVIVPTPTTIETPATEPTPATTETTDVLTPVSEPASTEISAPVPDAPIAPTE